MSDEGYNRLKVWLLGDANSTDPEERLGLLSQKGMSVENLARKTGVTRTAIYKYLNDQARPTPENLFNMSEALGIEYKIMTGYCTPRKAGRPYAKK